MRWEDLDVAGRVVLVRSDLNVPLGTTESGDVVISDDGRIRASVPTIAGLRDRGAKVVVVAHLGRPKGTVSADLSLLPVATRLAELMGSPVEFVDAVSGNVVAQAVASMNPGEVLLLENVRFDARETSKDPAQRAELAGEWASWADAYVSDGFGVVHREQASVTDVARLLPHAPGALVDKEISSFARVLDDPQRPYVVILGGSKVSDKLAVLANLVEHVDRLVIGGGMAFTFLKAQGLEVGNSLLEPDMIPTVQKIVADAHARGVQVLLPTDVVVASEFAADAPTRVVAADAIPEGWMGLDIGPETRRAYVAALRDAQTVVWNGPMGVFEMPAFAAGTLAVAEALADSTAFTVVGGGDSAAAIRALGVDEAAFSHISTGGGASLELLEGRVLPGLAVLEENS